MAEPVQAERWRLRRGARPLMMEYKSRSYMGGGAFLDSELRLVSNVASPVRIRAVVTARIPLALGTGYARVEECRG